jgi:hypothetical protein
MANLEATISRILSLKSVDLQRECRESGLRVGGTKTVMQERIFENLGISRQEVERFLATHGENVQRGDAVIQDRVVPVPLIAPVRNDPVPVAQMAVPPQVPAPVQVQHQVQNPFSVLHNLVQQVNDRLGSLERRVEANNDLGAHLPRASEFSAEILRTWPDLKLKSSEIAENYEVFKTIGRLAGTIGKAMARGPVAEMAKEIEEIATLQATKLVLQDRGEDGVAESLSSKDKGTFMDRWENSIKEARKIGAKRKGVDSPSWPLQFHSVPVTPVSTVAPFQFQSPPFASYMPYHQPVPADNTTFRQQMPVHNDKRSKVVCWNCGQAGHTKPHCKQAIKEGNEGHSVPPSKT